jgi:hypothetical protein
MRHLRTKIHVEFLLCERIKIFLKSPMQNTIACHIQQKNIETNFLKHNDRLTKVIFHCIHIFPAKNQHVYVTKQHTQTKML